MRRRRFFMFVAAILGAAWFARSAASHGPPPPMALAGVAAPLAPSAALGTAFTYQGQLTTTSGGVSGTCDFQFGLWDAAAAGTQAGATETEAGVSLTNGLFTASLNESGGFGTSPFTGEARWLEIAVRCPAGSGAYTTIDPRQPVTAAPYAFSARSLEGRTPSMLEALNRSAPPESNLVTGIEPAGWGTSVTIGRDGLPIISQIDCMAVPTGRLRVEHCGDPACTTWTSHSPASAASEGICLWGDNTAIAIGSDGLPLIAYRDSGGGGLRTVHCADVACAGATVSTLGQDGAGASLAIGADGLGLIAHYDGDLEVSHCSDTSCSTATTTALDTVGDVGAQPAIALGVDGLALVSYYDVSNDALKVAHCRDVQCSAADISTIDGSAVPEMRTSLVIGTDGRGLISYAGSDPTTGVFVAHCSGLGCAAADKTYLDTAAMMGYETSITIGADGLGLIVYTDDSSAFKAAHCGSLDCSSFDITVPAASRWVTHAAVTIGSDGLPFVSAAGLHVIHCASPFCAPYFRRR